MVATLVVALASAPARGDDGPAPAPAPTIRAEAAERFDRAMVLLAEGDDAGALAELLRVQAIAPHPRVAYNLGLVYASLARPVEAERALGEALATPSALPASALERARQTREDQRRRVAHIAIATNVPAALEIDGAAVGRTPLAEPIAVAAGTHVVAALSAGHLPTRREITVAGLDTVSLDLQLEPTERRLAHLVIRTSLPGVDVFVDDARVGLTPLPASVAVSPGPRTVELRRAGYRPVRRELTLDDGATAELAFELAEDDEAHTPRGLLVLSVSEPDPDVTVDGVPKGAYRAPLALPLGLHTLRVARGGFLPIERTVTVRAAAETTVRLTLAPTPETRATYKHQATLQRTAGLAATLAGLPLAVASATVLVLNRGPLADAEAERDAALANPDCNELTGNKNRCDALLDPADDHINRHRTIRNFAIGGLALGIVAASAGAILLVTGPDPARYDQAPVRDLALSGWLSDEVSGASGGLLLAGRF